MKPNYSDAEKADMAEAERRERRNSGLDLMQARDRGGARLSNGVIMEWHVDNRQPYQPYRNLPPGYFVLTIDGKSALFDTEEFKEHFRWV